MTAGPYVPAGTYSVALLIDGQVADTKTVRVARDPAVQMSDAQARRYDEIAMDLHELQRRGEAAAAAMEPFYQQMSQIAAALPSKTDVPAGVKSQFDALEQQFDAVRVKFGVPAPAGGGRGRGRGAAADPANLVARVGALKGEVLAFWEPPSDTLMKRYGELKDALPKAIDELNRVYTSATPVALALGAHGLSLKVPAPAK